jgi:hypothetical protein
MPETTPQLRRYEVAHTVISIVEATSPHAAEAIARHHRHQHPVHAADILDDAEIVEVPTESPAR